VSQNFTTQASAEFAAGLVAAGGELDVQAERLLEAARGQLIAFGLRRTSLDEIARVAGVGRATLFRRFAGREALLLALAAREAQRSISRVDSQLTGIADPESLLVNSVLAVIDEIAGNELLQRLLVTDPEQMLPLLTGRGAPIIAMGREYIAGLLRRIRDAGAALTGEPDVLAEVFARLVLSLALSPEGVLPLHDAPRLEEIARTSLMPMLLRTEDQEKTDGH
jgi:AcrR family transcriptional regulator